MMYIEPFGIFLIVINSGMIGAFIYSQVVKRQTKTTEPPQANRDDRPEWDIGAYSDAWWKRDRSEPDASEDDKAY